MASWWNAPSLDAARGLPAVARVLQQSLSSLATKLPSQPKVFQGRAVAVATTVTDADDALWVDTTAGSVTVTLPAPKTVLGRRFTVVKLVAGNTLTVQVADSSNINGAATKAWTTAFEVFTFQAALNGTTYQYYIVG